MKKMTLFVFLLVPMLVLGVFFGGKIDFAFAQDLQAETQTYVVTANYARVYESASFSSTILATLAHNDKVEIIFENEAPKESVFQTDGAEFVFFETEQGFVFSELLTPESKVLTFIPNFNGKTNSACKVFLQAENEIVESEISLEKGHQIFLYQGFDGKKDFTPVAVIVDGEVIYGFLQTSAVSPNGINPVLISCILLIVAVLGIVFIWLFARRKHSK